LFFFFKKTRRYSKNLIEENFQKSSSKPWKPERRGIKDRRAGKASRGTRA
jgi:hypothetical protein